MIEITPSTTTGSISGVSTLATVFKEMPKTQAVGIAMVITAGTIIAIDIATSRGFNITLDWPNKKVVLTKSHIS